MNEKYITIKNTDNEVCWPETHADQIIGLDITNIPSSGDVAGLRTTVANIVNAASNTLNSDPWRTYIRSTVDSTNVVYDHGNKYDELFAGYQVNNILNTIKNHTSSGYPNNTARWPEYIKDCALDGINTSFLSNLESTISDMQSDISNAAEDASSAYSRADEAYDYAGSAYDAANEAVESISNVAQASTSALNSSAWGSYIRTTVDSTNIAYQSDLSNTYGSTINARVVANIMNKFNHSFSKDGAYDDRNFTPGSNFETDNYNVANEFFTAVTNTLNADSATHESNRGKTFVLKLTVDESGHKTLNWVAEE